MARLTMSFLGTFQVTLAQQPITHFRSSNNQGLLVYLTLQDGRPHAREVLATLFWPEESDKNARNNLRQALFQLRTLLGDLDRPDQTYLLATRQTVQFNPEGDYALDVQQFLQAIEAGDLQTAVGHYGGDLLPGFTCDSARFEEWLRQEREHLHRLALEAMFEVTEEHLKAGRYEEAQAVARRQLSLEPWRERAHRQLMRAYALAGDRGTALAQYRACRETLEDELGVEPSAATVSLADAIEGGRVGPLASDEPLPPPTRARHNLPADTTAFIGRELELAEIGRRLTQGKQRLLTIVGAGGMGKTRLALAAGAAHLEKYRDGVFFVDLAPLSQPEEIAPAVAAAIEYQAPDKSQALFPQLLQTLSRRQLLLILDNLEHLLAGAPLVNDLLRACSDVAVLATSRQRLNLASESRYELGGLDFPDTLEPADAMGYTAVQLFVDAGRRARSDFDLTEENVSDVMHICRLVQGMPLALVLAASWLELLKPAEIAAEIEAGIDFLEADLVDLPPRQHSVQAVFERSWQMMSPAEQGVLADLSIFRGGFTREAAEQVAGANLRVLLSLTNKSLLRRRGEGDRFTMHELLRQYAAGRRRQGNSDEHIRMAHCRYFARLVEEENRRGFGYSLGFLGKQLGTDADDISQAWSYSLEQGLSEELSRMALGQVAIAFVQGTQPTRIFREAIQSLRQRGVPEHDRSLLSLRLTELSSLAGIDLDWAHSRLLTLVPMLEASGNHELCYHAYDLISHMYNQHGDSEALQWAERARLVAHEVGEEALEKQAEGLKLWLQVDLGLADDWTPSRLQKLLAYFEPAFPESQMLYGILWSLSVLSDSMGAYDRALQYGERGLTIAKRQEDLYWIGHATQRLADTCIAMGQPEKAGHYLLDALEWHLAIGQEWQTLGSLWSTLVNHRQLFGAAEELVPTLAMVYYHPEAVPLYRQRIDEALPAFEAEMTPGTFAAAWERGKEMDFETAVAQVRTALRSAGTQITRIGEIQ